MGFAIRRKVEEELIPGLVAVQALFHAADAATLGTEWLEQVSSVMPAEAGFMADMAGALTPPGMT